MWKLLRIAHRCLTRSLHRSSQLPSTCQNTRRYLWFLICNISFKMFQVPKQSPSDPPSKAKSSKSQKLQSKVSLIQNIGLKYASTMPSAGKIRHVDPRAMMWHGHPWTIPATSQTRTSSSQAYGRTVKHKLGHKSTMINYVNIYI